MHGIFLDPLNNDVIGHFWDSAKYSDKPDQSPVSADVTLVTVDAGSSYGRAPTDKVAAAEQALSRLKWALTGR